MKMTWIRELFSFSRKERTGIIALLFLIFILVVIGKLIPRLIPSDTTNISKWEAEVNAFLANNTKDNSHEHGIYPIVFDPNRVDSVGLARMGVPQKVAANWVKYLKKGGRFSNNEGVKKIFGMTTELFSQLDHFMVIDHVEFTTKKADRSGLGDQSGNRLKHDTIFLKTFSGRKKERVTVQELNTTDSLQLLQIPGIGPVLASRIIRYRKLLGGYYDISQLREVYGMREENFTTVSRYLTVNPTTLKTFNINFSTIQELGRHPYMGFRTARKVFRLRDKIGKFLSPDDLSSVVAADSLKRLLPYIIFSQ